MSSRVITGTQLVHTVPVQWLAAIGEPVNAAPSPGGEDGTDGPGEGDPPAAELDGARERIHELERRIQELEYELPRHREMGRQEGRAEGEATAAKQAAAAARPLLDKLASSIAELASYRARFRHESEPELLALALAVARKILRRELTVDPHSLLGILKSALETINQAEVLLVRAAPEDAAHLSGRLRELGLPDAVELVADRMLERGSVIVDTKRGQIDASIQTQLAEIENGFADRIAAHKIK